MRLNALAAAIPDTGRETETRTEAEPDPTEATHRTRKKTMTYINEPTAYTEPPKKRPWIARHKILTGLGIVAVLAAIGTAAGAGSSGTTTPAGSKPLTSTTSATPPAEQVTETTSTPTYGTPKPADFKLTVKTTSKQCFDTAGCLVEYKVTAAYSGPELDPAKSYDVTYHVSGPEDGGQDDTFTVTGDSYEQPFEQSAQTPSSKTRLRVKVTDVSES